MDELQRAARLLKKALPDWGFEIKGVTPTRYICMNQHPNNHPHVHWWECAHYENEDCLREFKKFAPDTQRRLMEAIQVLLVTQRLEGATR